MPLTRVQITQRSRERKKIMKEELAKHGIHERCFYIDDKIYDHFSKLAESMDPDVNIHSLLFLAMRKFLSDQDPSTHLENHYFMLESAMIDVHMRLDSSQTLGSPREAQQYIKSNEV